MSAQISPVRPGETPAARVVDVELLALDLGHCTRCLGTLANLEAAIAAVRGVLAATGTSVRLEKILVDSEEQARRHRFTLSPTVRVDGRDIAFDTLASRCESCTDLCGCEDGVSCRVWPYQGRDYTEAPVGLVIEALLRAILGPEPVGGDGAAGDPGDEVPDNLRRYFAGRAARRERESAACCSPAEQAACCEPGQKEACCGGPEPAACGCR